jgi:hypothetical protein
VKALARSVRRTSSANPADDQLRALTHHHHLSGRAQAWGDAAFPTRYFVSYDNATDAFAFGWRFEAASGGQ